MRWLVGSLICVLMLVGCKKSEDEIPKAVAVSEDGSMEIVAMTFNVRYENKLDKGAQAWRERVPGIVSMLNREEVEILGIQEGQHGQVADLWASLPEFSFVGKGRSDGGRKGEYAGIFFRKDRFYMDVENSGMFWLSETPDKAGSMSWGSSFPRVATWVKLLDRGSGQTLWVVNSHLDHRSQSSREKGVQLIAKKLAGMNPQNDPVIWLGDFNATEWNPAIQFIQGKQSPSEKVKDFVGLKETYDLLHPKEKKRGTLHFWMSDPNRQWKVDHIFVSKEAKVSEAEVIKSGEPYLSDHFPVKARVKFPKN